MSEYSKELIELNWKILNGSYSQEDKKNADKFLIEFKVNKKIKNKNKFLII